MKFLIVLCAVFLSAQAFPKVKWMDPFSMIHTPGGAIMAGRPALEGEVPYQAGVVVDHARFCGGALISDTMVLTSASCVAGLHKFEIYLGSLDLVGAQNVEARLVLTSSLAKVHDNFDILTSANSVGIIILPRPVIFSSDIRPIRLPRMSQHFMDLSGKTAVVSGWGATSKSEAHSNPFLKVANVTVVSQKRCVDMYGADVVLDVMFCVDTRQQFSVPCFGDTGAPVAIVESDGEKTLFGVLNWGLLQECSSVLPEVATRIDFYLEWIERHGGPSVRP